MNLKASADKRILFVINPGSGTDQSGDLKGKIAAYAEKHSIACDFYTTAGKNDAKKIRELLDTFQPETVVAAGGDGTINLVAAQLIRSPVSLGILPSGSANGLAYNLGIPKNIDEALRTLTGHKPKQMDVLKINEKYCFHLSDVGINARIVKRFEEEGARGLAGYAKQLIKELFSKKAGFSFHIEHGGTTIVAKAELH